MHPLNQQYIVCIDIAGVGAQAGNLLSVGTRIPKNYEEKIPLYQVPSWQEKDLEILGKFEDRLIGDPTVDISWRYVVPSQIVNYLSEYDFANLKIKELLKTLITSSNDEVRINNCFNKPFLDFGIPIGKWKPHCLHEKITSTVSNHDKMLEMHHMDSEYPQYEFIRNCGYLGSLPLSNCQHRQALKRYGKSPYHRSYSYLTDPQWLESL